MRHAKDSAKKVCLPHAEHVMSTRRFAFPGIWEDKTTEQMSNWSVKQNEQTVHEQKKIPVRGIEPRSPATWLKLRSFEWEAEMLATTPCRMGDLIDIMGVAS